MNESQLHIGDTILYRGAFGLGPQQDAVITGFDEKNFRRLAGLNDGHWCYLNQIDSVVRSDWINVDDIIEAFPGFLNNGEVNGCDLVDFIGDLITRSKANLGEDRPEVEDSDIPLESACDRNQP